MLKIPHIIEFSAFYAKIRSHNHSFTHQGCHSQLFLNTLIDLTKLRMAIPKIPQISQISQNRLKPVNPVLQVSPWPPGPSLGPSLPGSTATFWIYNQKLKVMKSHCELNKISHLKELHYCYYYLNKY